MERKPELIYSKRALEGLDALVEREKSKAVEIQNESQIRKLFRHAWVKYSISQLLLNKLRFQHFVQTGIKSEGLGFKP